MIKKTRTGQPVVKGRFGSKLTEGDIDWMRSHKESLWEDVVYGIQKRMRDRNEEVYPRSGEMIYRNFERVLHEV